MIRKIKKALMISAGSIVGIYILAMSIVLPYCINMLEFFQPIRNTSQMLKSHYELKGSNPSAYGFDYQDVSFKGPGQIKLTGWYIPSEKKTDSCIYFVHGWKSSGASTLPYLDIIKEHDLHKKHNLFIINLRNSGDSSRARTDLGYVTSNDVLHGMKFLKNEYGIKEVNMYSISMGAMATLTALNIHKEAINDLGIRVNKTIFDSPLANAIDAIKSQDSAVQLFDNLIYVPFLFIVNNRWDDMLYKLNFEYMMPNVNTDNMMILQAEKDSLTRLPAIQATLSSLPNRPEIHVFEKGSHARIFHIESNKLRYSKLVGNFLNSDFKD